MLQEFKVRSLTRLRRSLFAGLRNETGRHRHSSAVVFAPHQDDECLGCGGTIILKRDAGSQVKIVFMTDGSTSHRRFMSEDELRQLRNDEAVRAAEKLGLGPADVQFLNFPDGRLSSCHETAVARVLAILKQHRPDEVFVPYRADGTTDHEATYRIVVEATQKSGLALRVCEYPIWLWNQWPWVPMPFGVSRETVKHLRRILQSGFGRIVFKEFRSGVFVGDVLQRKRQALAQHRSQMTVMIDGVEWPTLSDVSNGEFLNCFFQEFEVFRCWNNHPNTSA